MNPPPGQREAPADDRHSAHILSFDVEEYFHVEAAAEAGLRPEQWESFPSRLRPCVRRILEMLSNHHASATFFVLGWVARRQPDLVRSIAQAGHEIASHGMTHTMLCRLTREQLRCELLDSRRLLEDLTGKPVCGYRAPTFSITRKTAWALDVLADAGYAYDSSVFPVRHDRYGVPGAPRFVHRAVGPGGGKILEIPPSTLRVLGVNWPVGGGGYLRLLPECLVASALKRAQGAGRCGVIYLHPWEMDPDQPVLPMSRPARWRHRVALRRTEKKLTRLLAEFEFRSVAETPGLSATAAEEEYRYGPSG